MYITALSTLSSLFLNRHLYADDKFFFLSLTQLRLKHYSPTECSSSDLYLDDCQSFNSQFLQD